MAITSLRRRPRLQELSNHAPMVSPGAHHEGGRAEAIHGVGGVTPRKQFLDRPGTPPTGGEVKGGNPRGFPGGSLPGSRSTPGRRTAIGPQFLRCQIDGNKPFSRCQKEQKAQK